MNIVEDEQDSGAPTETQLLVSASDALSHETAYVQIPNGVRVASRLVG
jgi:hypothetical protein